MVSRSSPRLSVILVTDTYETIRPVIERLRRQTVRERIEVVLVAPSAGAVSPVHEHGEEFAGVRVVEHEVADLGPERAAGIQAAAAPIVFLGETHTYPHPGFAEALIAAMGGPWSIVVPCFGNANPNGALSWSAFLFDYGRWSEGPPAGELTDAPGYNVAYRRSMLVGHGSRLPAVLENYDDWRLMVHGGGHRIYFEPAARIDHVNIARASDWVSERFASGVLVGSRRAQSWSPVRRLAYLAASVLIPPVLVWRVLPGIRRTMRRQRLPAATIPAVIASAILKAAGEVWGCLAASPRGADRRMQEYEMHKLAYAGRAKA
jgi:hypothetical protein